jgi:uncharacterized membrane protein
MKTSRLAVCIATCLLLLLILPYPNVNGQNYFTYTVQINSDGSALWKITNFSAVTDPVDTWANFQNKVYNLLDSAANLTHREMNIDENSLQLNTTVTSASKTTEYSFLWQNFSKVEGNEIVFGDVFGERDFFRQLYGDAALQICYPQGFSVKTVAPQPSGQNNLEKTLDWARTQDLVESKTSIILTDSSGNQSSSSVNWQLYAVIAGVAALGVAVSLVGFFSFKKSRGDTALKTAPIAVETHHYETEEEKVIKILKTSGGSMRQSNITEKCHFSKAKTSQLLSALEKSGNITRYKKGRDKIVNLTEERVKAKNNEKPDKII